MAVIDDILTRSAHSLAKGYNDLHHIVLGDERLEKSREEIENALHLALAEAINQMAALQAARGHKKELQETQLDNLHTLANVITVASNIEVIMASSVEFSKKYFELVDKNVFFKAFASMPIERQAELTFAGEVNELPG